MTRANSITMAALLALLIAGPVWADSVNILQNPGFETGSFDPWYQPTDGGDDEGEGDKEGGEWFVSDVGAHSGQYCVEGHEGRHVCYDFVTPIPTETIDSFSFWLQRPASGMFMLGFEYADGGFSSWMVPFITDEKWHLMEIDVSTFTPESDLVRMKFGGLAPSTSIPARWDDFSMTLVPEPGTLSLLALIVPILAMRRRAR